MAIIFGTKIEIPPFEENILAEIVQRRGEREMMSCFLDEPSLNGEPRLSEIIQQARSSSELTAGISGDLKEETAGFIAKKMKRARTSADLSLYEDIKLRLVEQIEGGKIGKYARMARLTASKEKLLFGLPEKLKKSEAILVGKIRSDIRPGDVSSYLVQLEIRRVINLLSKDLFFAINRGLDKDKALQFMAIFYELKKRQSAVPTNEEIVKLAVAEALLKGANLELIHLKCPRYKYPEGKKLEIIDHCDDEIVKTKEGPLLRLAENDLLANLSEIKQIFLSYSINTSLKILIMDQDIDDHIPTINNPFSKNTDLVQIMTAMERYKSVIELKTQGKGDRVEFLRSHLDQFGLLSEFNRIRANVLRDFVQGRGGVPARFVEAEVDDYYEKNKARMAVDYGRSFARDIAYAKLATMQALGVLRKIPNGRPFFLIEEDRKNENSFIGGVRSTALPVFFAKLRNTETFSRKIKMLK